MKIKKAILHEFYNEELEMLDSDVVIHEHVLDKTKPDELEIITVRRLQISSIIISIILYILGTVCPILLCAYAYNEPNIVMIRDICMIPLYYGIGYIMYYLFNKFSDEYDKLVNNFFADEVKEVEKKNTEIVDKYNGTEEKETFKKEFGEWVSTLLCYPPDIMYEMIVKFVKEHEDRRNA